MRPLYFPVTKAPAISAFAQANEMSVGIELAGPYCCVDCAKPSDWTLLYLRF